MFGNAQSCLQWEMCWVSKWDSEGESLYSVYIVSLLSHYEHAGQHLLSKISCMRLIAAHVSSGVFHLAVRTLLETIRNECGLQVRLEGGKVEIGYQLWM